jgi:hypothetical protein
MLASFNWIESCHDDARCDVHECTSTQEGILYDGRLRKKRSCYVAASSTVGKIVQKDRTTYTVVAVQKTLLFCHSS